jgi:hypothetical protein
MRFLSLAFTSLPPHMSHVPFPTCPHVNKDNDKQSQWEHMLGDVIIMGALTHEVIHMVSMLAPQFFFNFSKFFLKKPISSNTNSILNNHSMDCGGWVILGLAKFYTCLQCSLCTSKHLVLSFFSPCPKLVLPILKIT